MLPILGKLMSYDGVFRMETSMAPMEIEAKLLEAMQTNAIASFTKQRFVGEVTRSELKLARLRPFFGNSFAPRLVATIHREHGRTIVEGHYTMWIGTKLFVALWFGICIAFTLITAAISVMGLSSREDGVQVLIGLILPLSGVGMCALGYGLVRIGKMLGRSDITYIECQLRELLDAL